MKKQKVNQMYARLLKAGGKLELKKKAEKEAKKSIDLKEGKKDKKQEGGGIGTSLAGAVMRETGAPSALSVGQGNLQNTTVNAASALSEMRPYAEVADSIGRYLENKLGRTPTEQEKQAEYNRVFQLRTKATQQSGVSKDDKTQMVRDNLSDAAGQPLTFSDTAQTSNTGFDFTLAEGGSLTKARPAVLEQIKRQLNANGVSQSSVNELMRETVGMSAKDLALNSSELIGKTVRSDRKKRLDDYKL